MLELGSHEWRFCRNSDCHDRDLIFGLRDPFWARQWLEKFQGDAVLMATMRSLLAQEYRSSQLSIMPDQAIIDAIADLLRCGVLHIHTQPSALSGQEGRQHASGQSPKSEPAPPVPRSAPAPAVPVSPTLSDPPTFSADLHVGAQVATLVGAAAEGSAFCAHCTTT